MELVELFATTWLIMCVAIISSTTLLTDPRLALELPLILLSPPLPPVLLLPSRVEPRRAFQATHVVMMLLPLDLLAMILLFTHALPEAKVQSCVDSKSMELTELVEPFATIWWTMCAAEINSTTLMTDLPHAGPPPQQLLLPPQPLLLAAVPRCVELVTSVAMMSTLVQFAITRPLTLARVGIRDLSSVDSKTMEPMVLAERYVTTWKNTYVATTSFTVPAICLHAPQQDPPQLQ